MQFSITAILFTAVYGAFAFASLIYPEYWVVIVVRTLLYLAMAMATIIAFDRRSTPMLSFVVFAGFAFANFDIASGLVLYLMTELGVKTGSNEFAYFQELLSCHFTFVVAVFGFVVGKFVGFWSVRRNASTLSEIPPKNS